MGMTLGELQGRLRSELDVIPAASAREKINDALREIYDEGEWGFLLTDGFIRTPALIEGTANVIKFSNVVTLDNNINLKLSEIAEFDVDLFERQFRVLNSVEVDKGFTYKIIDWDFPNSTITIDPPYQDISNVAARVQILKLYYKPPYFNPPYEVGIDPVPDPIIDFERFEFVVSPQFQRRLILNATQSELYKWDPYREIISEPRYLIPHSYNDFEEPLFEMYPIPRFSRVFRVKYLRRGNQLKKDSDRVPDIFTKDLILSKAKILSYEWATANADKLKLKTVGRFGNLIALEQNRYEKLLESARKKDEERFPKAYLGNFSDIPEYEIDLECMGETLLLNF